MLLGFKAERQQLILDKRGVTLFHSLHVGGGQRGDGLYETGGQELGGGSQALSVVTQACPDLSVFLSLASAFAFFHFLNVQSSQNDVTSSKHSSIR